MSEKEHRQVIVKICNHKNKIAEREFYINQKNKIVGTRIICKTCGLNEFIEDNKIKLK